MSDLIIQEAEQFSIEPTQAKELIGNLPQIQKEREALQEQFNEVIKMDIELPETHKLARDLRLRIQKNRTQGISVWHKNTKDFFLRGGQFVDAIKRRETAVNEAMEKDLEQIERYAEIQEQKRIEKMRLDRISKAAKYQDYLPSSVDLGLITEEEFIKLLKGCELQYEADVEAAKKAEEERLAEIKRQETIRKNREKLLPYFNWIEGFGEIDFEHVDVDALVLSAESKKEQEKKEQQRIAKENELLKKKAEEERKKAEEERVKQQEEFRKQAEEKAKIEAELAEEKAKKEAEEKAKKDSEEKAKKEAERLAKAPVKKQLTAWVDSFQIPSSDIDTNLKRDIEQKFQSFKKWCYSEIENL